MSRFPVCDCVVPIIQPGLSRQDGEARLAIHVFEARRIIARAQPDHNVVGATDDFVGRKSESAVRLTAIQGIDAKDIIVQFDPGAGLIGANVPLEEHAVPGRRAPVNANLLIQAHQ